MAVRLIAADIDGTLVNKDKILLESTKKAVSDFCDKGGVFVIASGRPLNGIKRYISELGLDKRGGYIISFNGSFILDARDGSPVRQNFIDTETARAVVRTADKYSLNITTYSGNKAVTERADDEYFLLETRINLLEKVYVPSLEAEINAPVPKFLITGDGDKLEKYERILREELDNVTVFRSEPFFLEIVPKSVNKGVSLTYLEEYLGIEKSETMACGDGFNDVYLLNAAGIAVAMGNAQKPVIEASDFVTLTNNEDGVGEAIRKFAL